MFTPARFYSCLVCAAVVSELPSQAEDAAPTVVTRQTPTGDRFGTWGKLPDRPSPTLFVLASTVEGTLGDAYFRQCGNALAADGYLLVSIDLPCHGKQHRPDEPAGLTGWRHRCEQGEDFVAETNKRLARVLDHLIASGHTDSGKVAVCGTSRGGYLALQFAAHDGRVKCVAAYAPVTDLTALREFHGSEKNELVQSLSMIKQAGKLSGRAVWIIIGDSDDRVGTDHAIDLARRITKESRSKGVDSQVDLHVIAEPRGHTTPTGAAERSAVWIRRHITLDAARR